MSRMSVIQSLAFSISKDDPEWAPRVAGRVRKSWGYLTADEQSLARQMLDGAIAAGKQTWQVWAELRDYTTGRIV